jgi:hypothetical protein
MNTNNDLRIKSLTKLLEDKGQYKEWSIRLRGALLAKDVFKATAESYLGTTKGKQVGTSEETGKTNDSNQEERLAVDAKAQGIIIQSLGRTMMNAIYMKEKEPSTAAEL